MRLVDPLFQRELVRICRQVAGLPASRLPPEAPGRAAECDHRRQAAPGKAGVRTRVGGGTASTVVNSCTTVPQRAQHSVPSACLARACPRHSIASLPATTLHCLAPLPPRVCSAGGGGLPHHQPREPTASNPPPLLSPPVPFPLHPLQLKVLAAQGGGHAHHLR
jgi:hypothetical protein